VERKLAVLLGIPMNGLDPALSELATKSGGRRVFREAGIDHPLGAEDLRSSEEIEEALIDLRRQRPSLERAVLKLNDSFSGKGNAIFHFPRRGPRDGIRRGLGRGRGASDVEQDDLAQRAATRECPWGSARQLDPRAGSGRAYGAVVSWLPLSRPSRLSARVA
jgi:hypothetical protein